MQGPPSSQSITIKLGLMLFLIVIDIIINSFVECSFNLSSESSKEIMIYFVPIQMFITTLTFIMVLILLWQTFPLRFGLIGALFDEFKFTFGLIIIFILISAIERGLKLSLVISDKASYSQATIWDNLFYFAFYYIRYLIYPIFYGMLISFCLRIIDPSFYQPNRWFK